jgi:FtsH-binding integral membrane protein
MHLSQFGGSVAEATIDIRNQFVRKVYTILTVQLVVTGAVSALSFLSDGYRAWIQGHPAMVWISVSSSSSSQLASQGVAGQTC